MPKAGRLIAEFDDLKVQKHIVEHLKEMAEDGLYDEMSEDELNEKAWESYFLWDDYWDMLFDDLTEILEHKNPDGFWKAEVNNFGWRNLDGSAYLELKEGRDIMRKVLPDTQCSFKVFNYGRGLAIRNWHHDSPTGNEWYYLVPCAASTYWKTKGYAG